MNSDWDSMSGAPPVRNDKSIDNNTKYPPPLTNNTEARIKINSQKHTHTQQTQNNDIENLKQRAQDFQVHVQAKSNPTKEKPLHEKRRYQAQQKRS